MVYHIFVCCMLYVVEVFRIQSTHRPKSTAKVFWKKRINCSQLLVQSTNFVAVVGNYVYRCTNIVFSRS